MRRIQLDGNVFEARIREKVSQFRSYKRISPHFPLYVIELKPIFQHGRTVGLQKESRVLNFRAKNGTARFQSPSYFFENTNGFGNMLQKPANKGAVVRLRLDAHMGG